MGKEKIDINDRDPALDTISSFSDLHSTAGSNRVVGLKGWRDSFSERGNAVVVSQGRPCWEFVLESRGWTILFLCFDDMKWVKRGKLLFPHLSSFLLQPPLYPCN